MSGRGENSCIVREVGRIVVVAERGDKIAVVKRRDTIVVAKRGEEELKWQI